MLFQYPGLMMMSLAGAGAAEILVDPADWLRGISAGLSAAGVALVVSAAVGLANGQCRDKVTSALCLMSAVVAYYYQSNWIFPLLIVVGGEASKPIATLHSPSFCANKPRREASRPIATLHLNAFYAYST